MSSRGRHLRLQERARARRHREDRLARITAAIHRVVAKLDAAGLIPRLYSAPLKYAHPSAVTAWVTLGPEGMRIEFPEEAT
jgi:hypothetical protein